MMWYVHYRIGGNWMVDGPYTSADVTAALAGHRRQAECQDAYVSATRQLERNDNAEP